MEFEKYGWKYQANIKDGKVQFGVVPPFEITAPPTLFRYYSTSERAIECVTNRYIYASHPDLFNDLYDCHEELIDFDDDDVIINFLAHGDESVKPKIKQALVDDRSNTVQAVQRNLRQILYRKMGVVCMTSKTNNILMWSYYTNNRGFLVEYEYPKFPFVFHGPFPVNYQEELEKISLKEAGIPLCTIFQSNVKHKGWEHEDEWRILIENPEGEMNSPSMFPELIDLGGKERKFTYPPELVKSIALGHYFVEPKELSIINNDVFEMTFNKEDDTRAKLLEYMASNSILAAYTSRMPNLREIGYFKGMIKKISSIKFSFNRIH